MKWRAPLDPVQTGAIAELQCELDTLMQVIQRSMRLVGGPVIAAEAGSNINLAKIVEFTRTDPRYLTPPCSRWKVAVKP